MKYDDKTLEEARGMAQLLLDSGLAFHGGRHGARFTGYLGRGGSKAPVGVSPIGVWEEGKAREVQRLPSKELCAAMRDMLLVRHEEFQAERKKRNSDRAKFYSSKAWLTLRYQVLSERGGRCECCGASAKDGVNLQVDHIKPRSKYPDLALDKSNLQVLCKACNMGKRDRHEGDDWRREKPKRTLVKQDKGPSGPV